MRMFGFLIVSVSIFFTIMCSFAGWDGVLPGSGLLNIPSFICVVGSVLGGCLIAYGSDTFKGGAIFKPALSKEEAKIAVGVYKLAVRMSIGSGFIGSLFGWIAILGNIGSVSGGMDMGDICGGIAVSLLTVLYGVVYAFCFFLPLQYYFQHQLDKDS